MVTSETAYWAHIENIKRLIVERAKLKRAKRDLDLESQVDFHSSMHYLLYHLSLVTPYGNRDSLLEKAHDHLGILDKLDGQAYNRAYSLKSPYVAGRGVNHTELIPTDIRDYSEIPRGAPEVLSD